jgi:hypothetical protein
MDKAADDLILAGLTALTLQNPERWWDLTVVGSHPIGNLNLCLLKAVSLLPKDDEQPLSIPDLKVPGVGTLSIKNGGDVELRELFRSFSTLYSQIGGLSEIEWVKWGSYYCGCEEQTTLNLGEWISDFGPNIGIIGRAEKRMVVASARLLLSHSSREVMLGVLGPALNEVAGEALLAL